MYNLYIIHTFFAYSIFFSLSTLTNCLIRSDHQRYYKISHENIVLTLAARINYDLHTQALDIFA